MRQEMTTTHPVGAVLAQEGEPEHDLEQRSVIRMMLMMSRIMTMMMMMSKTLLINSSLID